MALPSLSSLSQRSLRCMSRNEMRPDRFDNLGRRKSMTDSDTNFEYQRKTSSQMPRAYEKPGNVDKPLSRSGGVRFPPSYTPQYASGRRSSLSSITERNPVPISITLTRFVSKTEVGSNRGKSNYENQDRGFYQCRSDYYLMGVCDGHGPSGHLIAGYLASDFPHILTQAIASVSTTFQALSSTINKLAERLRVSGINCMNSGSTCVSVLIRNNTITCGNVGDSRAVLGRLRKGGWTQIPLSRVHLPSENGEYLRIVAAGGEVAEKPKAESAVRIYLRNKNYPGLHISRSIGDTVASLAGVTSEPDMKSVDLTPEDKFVVLASDGVWGVMESLEVVETLGKFWETGNAEGGCDRVKNEARARWAKKGKKIPDVTVSVGFFGVKRG